MTVRFLLEDGSGALLLEDGVSYLLQEVAEIITSSLLSSLVPQNFALTVNGQTSVTLSWTLLTSSFIIGYYVWRDDVLLTPVPVVGHTYIDSTVIADRHYLYAVAAADTSFAAGPQTPTLRADVLQAPNLTFESTYQIQPGEGGYPDIRWRWQ